MIICIDIIRLITCGESESSLWCTDLPSPAGRSRRTCGWCWGRGSPVEAPGPSSSSRSSTSPVSLTMGAQSAARTSAAPPWTFPGPPPGRPGDPEPPLQWGPTEEGAYSHYFRALCTMKGMRMKVFIIIITIYSKADFDPTNALHLFLNPHEHI